MRSTNALDEYATYRRLAQAHRSKLALVEATEAMAEAAQIAPLEHQVEAWCELAELELGQARMGACKETLARATLALLAQSNRELASRRAMLSKIWLSWGRYWHAAGLFERAYDSFFAAERVAVPGSASMSQVQSELGTLCLAQGDRLRAIAYYQASLHSIDDGSKGVVYANLGICLLLEEKYREAETALENARAVLQAAGDAPFEAQALLYLAWSQWLDGRNASASQNARMAVERLRTVSDIRTLALAESLAAMIIGTNDRGEGANLAALAQRHALELGAQPISVAARLLLCAHQFVGETGHAFGLERVATSLRMLSASRETVSDDVLLAQRTLIRIMPSNLVFLCDNGMNVRSQTAVVSLLEHGNLQRILLHLVKMQRTATHSELLVAAWPGEQIMKQAGENRLRVAMNTLRKLGCDWIVSDRGIGYRLDATLVFVTVAHEEDAIWFFAAKKAAPRINAGLT